MNADKFDIAAVFLQEWSNCFKGLFDALPVHRSALSSALIPQQDFNFGLGGRHHILDAHLGCEVPRDRAYFLRVLAVRVSGDHGNAAVAADSNPGVERDLSEKRNTKLIGRPAPAAGIEDVLAMAA